MVTIDFSNINISELCYTKKEWEHAFARANSEEAELSFKNSQFNQLSKEDLGSLVAAIKNTSNIVAMDLSDNPLFLTFDDVKIELLMMCAFNASIRDLNLGGTGFVSAGTHAMHLISRCMDSGIVRSVNLSRNNLIALSKIDLDLLFHAIHKSEIKSLNLNGNNLGYLDDEKFKIISDHLKGSNITHLSINGNHLSGSRGRQLQDIVLNNAFESSSGWRFV